MSTVVGSLDTIFRQPSAPTGQYFICDVCYALLFQLADTDMYTVKDICCEKVSNQTYKAPNEILDLKHDQGRA